MARKRFNVSFYHQKIDRSVIQAIIRSAKSLLSLRYFQRHFRIEDAN